MDLLLRFIDFLLSAISVSLVLVVTLFLASTCSEEVPHSRMSQPAERANSPAPGDLERAFCRK